MNSIFLSLFELLNNNLFGGIVTIEQVQDWLPLTAGFLCSVGTVLLVALPIWCVIKIVSSIVGGFGSMWGLR